MSSAMEEKEDVKFVKLQDGRQIAYREQGVTAPDATRRSLLVLHGIASSRLAGIPGNGLFFLSHLSSHDVGLDFMALVVRLWNFLLECYIAPSFTL
jgi:hypothetical protein